MKTGIFKTLGSFVLITFFSSSAWAVDVNFNLLNVNTPDQNRLQQTYSNAYGFSPQQIAPAMMAPAPEVPSILQIAKSAATLPLSIWGLRKLGFSYMDILNMYMVPPTSMFNPSVPYDQFGPGLGQAWSLGQQYGNIWPRTASLADPVIIQLNQVKLLTDYMKVPYTRILNLPTDTFSFTRVVLEPWKPYPGFIPPGQAKKMGLWLPPGQAKKYYKHDHDDDDDDHHHHHGKHHGKGKGKWKWKD